MMHVFVLSKWATKFLFHDEPVNFFHLTIDSGQLVTMNVYPSAAFPVVVVLATSFTGITAA